MEIRELLIGQIAWIYIRPGYYKSRVEAVGHDWAVVRIIDGEGSLDDGSPWIIAEGRQWTHEDPYPEQEMVEL